MAPPVFWDVPSSCADQCAHIGYILSNPFWVFSGEPSFLTCTRVARCIRPCMMPIGQGWAMRLVKCSDCGADISPRAKACPRCGAPRPRGCARLVAFLILGLGLLYVLASNLPSLPAGGAGTAAAPALGPEPQVEIVDAAGLMPREEVLRAVGIFQTNCVPLGGTMWSDLASVKAEVSREYAPFRLAKGWKTTITLSLAVPENPRRIPAFDRRAGVVAGHTLWYVLGGGNSPGYFASKRVSQMLCSAAIDEAGNDVFVSVPALSILP